MSRIEIYTDGSARGNPGPGGFGVILRHGHHEKVISGGFRLTTNNRMELLAVITGLRALKKNDLEVLVVSDSKYVIDAVQKGWLFNWIKTGFKGKKNKDLWMEFYTEYRKHRVRFQWIKGHNDHPFNERCDVLATTAADGTHLGVDAGYENRESDPALSLKD